MLSLQASGTAPVTFIDNDESKKIRLKLFVKPGSSFILCNRLINCKVHLATFNHLAILNLMSCIDRDLPIGSGLIESGRKHVLQARMKLPGTAWKIDNAEHMVRANKQWYQISIGIKRRSLPRRKIYTPIPHGALFFLEQD